MARKFHEADDVEMVVLLYSDVRIEHGLLLRSSQARGTALMRDLTPTHEGKDARAW
ncbi:hypothetical protein K523DRAFT_324687 [Schizophyllum commune Tattone D]|nr:hypothetical protein K523DRAFT_324687 [Schizophyllum commune Tattone D]